MNGPKRVLLNGCLVTVAVAAAAHGQCPYVYLGFQVPTTRALFESRVRALAAPTAPLCEPFLGHTVPSCVWRIPLADGHLEARIDDQPATRSIDRLTVERFDEPVAPERSGTWADSLAGLWGSSTEERGGRHYRSGRCSAFVRAAPGHLEVQLLYGLP
jgi:hypothetical protein